MQCNKLIRSEKVWVVNPNGVDVVYPEIVGTNTQHLENMMKKGLVYKTEQSAWMMVQRIMDLCGGERVAITKFKMKHSFLSNFAGLRNPIIADGIEYPSVEHYYQAMKFTDRDVQVNLSRSGSLVKRTARRLLKSTPEAAHSLDDWNKMKYRVMEKALRFKFSNNNPHLLKMLKSTEGLHLVEGNDWKDVYWGVCSTSLYGENKLGKLLMEIRDESK